MTHDLKTLGKPILMWNPSSGYILSSFNFPSMASNLATINSPCWFTSSQSRITLSIKPTSASSTNAPPKGGNSATFHCMDDPSPLDSSGERKTSTFPSKVQDFCPQAHSRQDHCHCASGHKHSWPSNMQVSQCSSQPSDSECYQWNKFDTYGHFHWYSPSISTTPPASSELNHHRFPKFKSARARLPTMTLWTFAVAGPVWDGSDEGMENEEMTKTWLQHQWADHLISSPAWFHNHHPFPTCLPTTFHVFPAPFEPYFKLHAFMPDPIGSSHLPQDLGMRSLWGDTVMSCNTRKSLLNSFWPVPDFHNHSHHLYNFQDSQKPSSTLELSHYQLPTLDIVYSKVSTLFFSNPATMCSLFMYICLDCVSTHILFIPNLTSITPPFSLTNAMCYIP